MFETGKIIFEPAPNAPSNLATKMSNYLQVATGATWLVDPTPNAKGEPSLIEQQRDALKQREAYEQAHPLITKAHELFPGVEVEFRDRPTTSNVIEANFNKDEDQ